MYRMAKSVKKGRFYIIVMGAALFLLLITSCRTDDTYKVSDTANGNDLPTILSALSGPYDMELVRAFTSSDTNSSSGIWVNGRGDARGTPDLAIVNLGVETLGNTAATARADAATAIDGTIAVLRDNGIADSDIQTRFFNISPRYNSVEVTRCLDEVDEESTSVSPAEETPTPPFTIVETRVLQGKLPDDCWATYEQVLTGYQVNNQLTVKVRDLDSLGKIIDEATESSGNSTRVDGINFAIEDSKKLQDEARVAAMEDLQDKAQQMASLAGVELGRLTFITESGIPGPAQFARLESHSGFAAAAPPQTSIQVGQLDVVVTVQGGFEIANHLP